MYEQLKTLNILEKLQITQESIEEASKYFMSNAQLNQENAKRLVDDWFQGYQNQKSKNDSNSRLKMIYLANDILQKSIIMKLDIFRPLFKDKLSIVFIDCFSYPSTRFKDQCSKIISLWQDRKVYPKEIIKEFLKGKIEKQNENKLEENVPDNLIPIPQDLVVYCQAYKELIKWEEKSKDFESRLSALEVQNFENANQAEIDSNLMEFKRSLELKQKYTANFMKSSFELVKNVDIAHLKMVYELKKILQKVEDIENIENKL